MQDQAIKPEKRETNEVTPTQSLELIAPPAKEFLGYSLEGGTQTKPSSLAELKRNGLNLGRLRQVELMGQSFRDWEPYKERILEICKGVLSIQSLNNNRDI